MAQVARLIAERTTLLVVDVQEKLFPAIYDASALAINIEFLIDAAQLTGVPVQVTEQYPRGLGPTIAPLAAKLPAHRPDKKTFSCCGAAGLVESLDRERRPMVVLCGIESHVCVSQTAFDLLEMGFQVALPVDGVGARYPLDHTTAIDRLRCAGALITTVEAVGFEWLRTADHPSFKTFSQLVQERSRRLSDAKI
ncbi:MAG: isochorismatase family protein [Gemmataceae bacterium]